MSDSNHKPIVDHRGWILDLLVEPIDSITSIWTYKGHVRGNHVHYKTKQWTYVVSGWLLVAHGTDEQEVLPGGMVYDPPGTPHAWRALEDTHCLVFTRGPRSGPDYERDTERLEVPLIS